MDKRIFRSEIADKGLSRRRTQKECTNAAESKPWAMLIPVPKSSRGDTSPPTHLYHTPPSRSLSGGTLPLTTLRQPHPRLASAPHSPLAPSSSRPKSSDALEDNRKANKTRAPYSLRRRVENAAERATL
ncbi:unnamed protein product, partial [Iphiclides podalirius]